MGLFVAGGEWSKGEEGLGGGGEGKGREREMGKEGKKETLGE